MTTPLSYRDALALAAAQRATKSAPNPVAVTAHTSEQIIAGRQRAATWAKDQLHALWAQTDPYSDAQVKAFAKKAASIMASAQTAAARTAAVGQSQQLAAVGIKVTPSPSNPVDVRAPRVAISKGRIRLQRHATTVDYGNGSQKVSAADKATESVFERPAEAFRYAATKGGDPAAQARNRINTLVDDNLMLAQRLAQQEVIAKAVDLDKPGPKITGYRRVIHPEMSKSGTCGMCIVAADRIYHVSELMPIHDRCFCTVSVITEDHDPGHTLNGQDLDQLYKHAGGNTAAHLKRTRYKVDEHGELGPVLVPRKPYKPQSVNSKRIAKGKRPLRQHSGTNLAALEKQLAKATPGSTKADYLQRTIDRLRGR